MNDKNGYKLSRYPVVKDSFTTANTQPPALDEFIPCSTACNHTKAKTHMDYGFQFNSTLQKMHFAYGIKSNQISWMNAPSIAILFDVQRPAIVKHIQNIYMSEGLAEDSTCSILEQVAKDGTML
jgi:hypothetical protein